MKALDIMHKQAQHMTVLIIEIVKGLMNEKSETEVTKAQKRKYLLEMAVKVCDWVNKFDPSNINYDSLKLPTNLASLNQYSDELVKDFPKVDITAELTFKKNSYRNNGMNST